MSASAGRPPLRGPHVWKGVPRCRDESPASEQSGLPMLQTSRGVSVVVVVQYEDYMPLHAPLPPASPRPPEEPPLPDEDEELSSMESEYESSDEEDRQRSAISSICVDSKKHKLLERNFLAPLNFTRILCNSTLEFVHPAPAPPACSSDRLRPETRYQDTRKHCWIMSGFQIYDYGIRKCNWSSLFVDLPTR